MVEAAHEPLQPMEYSTQTKKVVEPKPFGSQEDDLVVQRERMVGLSLRSEEIGLLRQLLENFEHLKDKIS